MTSHINVDVVWSKYKSSYESTNFLGLGERNYGPLSFLDLEERKDFQFGYLKNVFGQPFV